jgi:hypothetical protein
MRLIEFCHFIGHLVINAIVVVHCALIDLGSVMGGTSRSSMILDI